MTNAERADVAPKIAAIITSRARPSTRLAIVPAAISPADRAIAPAVDAPAAVPEVADTAAGTSGAVISRPLYPRTAVLGHARLGPSVWTPGGAPRYLYVVKRAVVVILDGLRRDLVT